MLLRLFKPHLSFYIFFYLTFFNTPIATTQHAPAASHLLITLLISGRSGLHYHPPPKAFHFSLALVRKYVPGSVGGLWEEEVQVKQLIKSMAGLDKLPIQQHITRQCVKKHCGGCQSFLINSFCF